MEKQAIPGKYTKPIIISLAVALLLLIFINYTFIMNPRMSSKTIKLAIGEWTPYTGQGLVKQGIVSALVTKIFNDMGYNPELHFMSWKRAESLAESGETDVDIQGTFPYIENDHRLKTFYLSDTLISLEYAFFYDSRNYPLGSGLNIIEDLENQVILSIDGYARLDTIETFYDTAIIYPNNISAFQELNGRKDNALVIEAKEVGEQLLEQKLTNIARYIHQAPLKLKVHFKLMLSKSNPENLYVIEEFNKKLKEFKSNPEAYNSLIKSTKNKIDLQRAVILQPFQTNGLIYCYRDRKGNESILIPNGTKAIIKEWDTSFLQFHSSAISNKTFVKVKLLNGPLSSEDKFYYVDGRCIQISNN